MQLFQVIDKGEGIPEEYMERIFDKFFQTGIKKLVKGYGLGLAFRKLAVEAHGGRIWVESEIGKGSVFKIMLPAAALQKC